MNQPQMYWIRTWDSNLNKPMTYKFTLNEILNLAQQYQMNMADVGMVLINLERVKLGLSTLDPKSASDGLPYWEVADGLG